MSTAYVVAKKHNSKQSCLRVHMYLDALMMYCCLSIQQLVAMGILCQLYAPTQPNQTNIKFLEGELAKKIMVRSGVGFSQIRITIQYFNIFFQLCSYASQLKDQAAFFGTYSQHKIFVRQYDSMLISTLIRNHWQGFGSGTAELLPRLARPSQGSIPYHQ